MAAEQTGPNELTLENGKKLIVPGPIAGVLLDADGVAIRYSVPGRSRDGIFGYDRDGVYKWNGQLYPLAQFRVRGDRREVTLPGGAHVALPAELTSFVQVEPALCVIVFDRNLGDPYNVVAYNSDGSQAWRIGERDGKPPGPFGLADVDEDGTLHAYSGVRGFAAVVSTKTGGILATEPYR
jgi:hypothetical protein